MAQSKEALKQTYPLPAYNFRVRVDDEAMSFAEVSGISAERGTATYRHGLSFWEGETITTFSYGSYATVTLKRGVVLGARPLFFYEWLKQGDLRTLVVSLCNEIGDPVISWEIAKAVPVKVEAPAFDARTNEASIESVELSVRGITVVRN
jgi:phage tail-like protein